MSAVTRLLRYSALATVRRHDTAVRFRHQWNTIEGYALLSGEGRPSMIRSLSGRPAAAHPLLPWFDAPDRLVSVFAHPAAGDRRGGRVCSGELFRSRSAGYGTTGRLCAADHH